MYFKHWISNLDIVNWCSIVCRVCTATWTSSKSESTFSRLLKFRNCIDAFLWASWCILERCKWAAWKDLFFGLPFPIISHCPFMCPGIVFFPRKPSDFLTVLPNVDYIRDLHCMVDSSWSCELCILEEMRWHKCTYILLCMAWDKPETERHWLVHNALYVICFNSPPVA